MDREGGVLINKLRVKLTRYPIQAIDPYPADNGWEVEIPMDLWKRYEREYKRFVNLLNEFEVYLAENNLRIKNGGDE